jgi:hypothetical protein
VQAFRSFVRDAAKQKLSVILEQYGTRLLRLAFSHWLVLTSAEERAIEAVERFILVRLSIWRAVLLRRALKEERDEAERRRMRELQEVVWRRTGRAALTIQRVWRGMRYGRAVCRRLRARGEACRALQRFVAGIRLKFSKL